MTDNTDQEKRPLSLGRTGGRLELRKPIEAGQVRQSFPHGRSKTVQVEVRKKRALVPGPGEKAEPAPPRKRRLRVLRRPRRPPRRLRAARWCCRMA